MEVVYTMADSEEKIVTDDDWKEQARKEKEQLKERRAAAERPMPAASFLMLVNSLAMQATLYMGRLSEPGSKEAKEVTNFDLAKHHIDLLSILEEKTKGNLSEQESKLLSTSLHELRMLYVQELSR